MLALGDSNTYGLWVEPAESYPAVFERRWNADPARRPIEVLNLGFPGTNASMVRRDIVGRYRGSYGGLFWTVINPLLTMVTYYFVFGVVLRLRFGEDGRASNFPLYFLAGMLPWLAFSEAAGRAPTTVWEHSNFVRKLLFPVETLPVNLVVAGLFSAACLTSEPLRLLLLVGFLGGFTTFSAFGVETLLLADAGRTWLALANVVGSNVFGIGGAWLSFRLAGRLCNG